MTNAVMLTYVDHTLLKPTATWNQIKTLCEEAMKYHTASVCIPCSFISRAHEAFPELNLCTVVGFPLGYHRQRRTQNGETHAADGVQKIIHINYPPS